MDGLSKDLTSIAETRKALLTEMTESIREVMENEGLVKLNFICTHNSRRSHLAQIWCATWANAHGLSKQMETYSGGTEATAFHPNAVDALKRCGFEIGAEGQDNPTYSVHFSDSAAPIRCSSKTYDDPHNPSEHFMAIMTCSEADENCPIVFGATKRFALTYEDPKASDNSPEEESTYDARCRQIGAEMGYLFQSLQY